ncbi:MAG: ATP-binding protein [Richelia sp. CSU_2_1]|nr:ATP-binding protein [Richelia sp. CSU_2_1]
MFHTVTLKNFRTHKLTTVELNPITLLIGNNSSGKTNLLAGIQYFCNLVRRGHPDRHDRDRTVIAAEDLYPHRYRLAKDDESIELNITWSNDRGKVRYSIEVFKDDSLIQQAGCRERLEFQLHSSKLKIIENGYRQASALIQLREKIEKDVSLKRTEQELCKTFFGNFANTFSYHFQPAFLKGLFDIELDCELCDLENRLETEDSSTQNQIKIPLIFADTGQNFQRIIQYIKENDEPAFTRFIALMRRFEPSFQGVRYDPGTSHPVWEFDLGRKGIVEGFPAAVLSDGFMKAAAISLLASLREPPTLILLEEIENGINPGNIQELMRWLWQMTSLNSEGHSSQFIITSHSPSVLREFYDRLDCVYTVRLDKRTRRSDVRNLNISLDTLVGIGTVEGEIIEREDGKRIVELPKYQLAELWYSGTIG